MKKEILAAALLFAATTCPVIAASNPYGFSDELDQGLKTAFNQLCNLKFKEADETIAALRPTRKERPMAALVHVVRQWWELSVDVMEIDEEASKPFLSSADECMKISEAAIDKGDSRGSASLAMGTTLGLMSRWSASNRAWIPAYLRGSKSANYLEKALKKNRRALDAYMCLGTFNYARDMIKNRTGDAKDTDESGGSNEGLDQLRKAYHGAAYFNKVAGLMLAGILTNDDPKNALPLLKELRSDFPESAFVHMIQVTALYNVGDLETMRTEAEDLLHKSESGPYPATFKTQAHFAKGLIAFREKDWKTAAEEFATATQASTQRNPYVTWAHLYQGYAFDAMGQRKKAKEQYNQVLKLPRRFASHDHARDRLEKPFKPTDPEMKKLEV